MNINRKSHLPGIKDENIGTVKTGSTIRVNTTRSGIWRNRLLAMSFSIHLVHTTAISYKLLTSVGTLETDNHCPFGPDQ